MTATPVLILGAGGQVGRELTAQRWPDGLAAVGLDRAALDVTDAGAIAHALATHAPALVVNAVAYTAVDKAESERDRAWAVNATAPGLIAAACADRGIGLIHLSTDYVFDGAKPAAYVEDDPVAPIGVYGASKEAGEAAIRARLDAHVILRTAWVFGRHGHNFVKTMLRLGAERPALRVVADQRGCPTEAADIAAAIATVAGRLLAGGAGLHGTFHYAGAPATTWHGFACEIFRLAAAHGRPAPSVEPIATADYPTPARRPANSMLDSGRLGRVYGIAPCDWAASLDRVVAALLGNDRAAGETA